MFCISLIKNINILGSVKMVDALVAFLAESVFGKAMSLAADELSLSFGVKKELKKLSDKVEMIQALLSDAQSKKLTSQVMQLWLKKLKYVALDAQILLDDFGYEFLRHKMECRGRDKVRSFFSSSNPVFSRPKMAHRIRGVLSSIDEVYVESNRIGLQAVELINSLPDHKAKRLTDPFVDDSEIVGRDYDASEVISMLISSDYERDLPVIAILGMGGQGKTTLAQVVYKDDKVRSYFDERVWFCVSDEFNVERILGRMWESLTQTTCQLSSREALVHKLKQKLQDKRYLLVLDDIWNENGDEWDVMRRCLFEIDGSKGSKVMATTRCEEVASAMRASRYHRLQILSEEQSLALFDKCAFSEGGATKTPELVAVAKRVLKRCGGVPLAIKAIGGLLYSKHCESEWLMIERSELWSDVPNTGGGGVLSAIRLSYDHLPSLSLKLCFAYYSTFPKDIVLKSDKLVQLWMAQGFLDPPKGSNFKMEDMGNVYFNILLKSSLLQDAQKDRDNNFTCKMHDLVHDLSLQLSDSYCIDLKDLRVGSNEIQAVHLSIFNHDKGMLKSLKGTVSAKLRSLHLSGRYVLEDFFPNFRCLTVLIINYFGAEELPHGIGKITNLRFLDVCRTAIHRLPKSFTELYYFQTICIRYLDELPEGYGNLISLRHIFVDEPWRKSLLPGLGQLTDLQTLPFFKVDKSSGCGIGELEHLDNLKGELRLFCLQNVSSYESALKSNLSKKLRIHTLELHWDERKNDCDDTGVMEGLKPHSNLKWLKIVGYQSQKLPTWINSLRNLVKFTLKGLDKCQLPSLGDLPCLEYLEVGPLLNVKCIGKEFYGWSNLDLVRKNSSSNGAEITLFPALRVLKFWYMDSLEEWSDAIDPTHPTAKIFPLLEEMVLLGLPNLSVFPNFGSLPCLGELYITECPKLTLPSSWNSLKSPTLEADERLVSIHSSADIHCLQSLRKLTIEDCDKLIAPFCSLKILASLKSLYIFGNPSLWPKDLHNLVNLKAIELGCCSAEIDSFPWPYSNFHVNHSQVDENHSVSLTSLKLFGWPKVTYLPYQIQYLTALTKLELWNFEGLEALPEWLASLVCLQDLQIWDCKNLKEIPSAEAFQRLTNLQNLTVYKCPILEERCAKGSGSEWPKIAHIRNIRFSC